VSAVRAEMEVKGDVSKLDTRTDSKGRAQPALKGWSEERWKRLRARKRGSRQEPAVAPAATQGRPTSSSLDAPMPTARSGIAAVVIGGRMFVFGGEAPAGTFNQAEAYDAGTNSWSGHARMPTARHGLGAAAVAGRIYVISGGPTPGASASAANEIFVP
jgi:Kelch motif